MDRIRQTVKLHMTEAFGNAPNGIMRVLEPCYGVGGLRAVFKYADLEHRYESALAMDLDGRLRTLFDNMELMHETGHVPGLFGPAGDMLAVDAKNLPDAEAIVCGPPCQPWAPNGKHAGAYDPRALCYMAVLNWIKEMADRGVLLFVSVENTKYILTKVGREAEPFASFIERYLQAHVPTFVFSIEVADLANESQVRSRAWLRGVRKDIAAFGKVPRIREPQPLIEGVSLSELLEDGVPNLESMDEISTAKKQRYIQSHIDAAKRKIRASPAIPRKVFAFDADRLVANKYSAQLVFDRAPVMRTKGPEIFVISADDIDAPIPQKRIFRYLTDRERFRLHGHDSAFAACSPSRNLILSVTGNAYAVPMLERAVSPLIKAVSRAGKWGSSKIDEHGRANVANMQGDAFSYVFNKRRRTQYDN